MNWSGRSPSLSRCRVARGTHPDDGSNADRKPGPVPNNGENGVECERYRRTNVPALRSVRFRYWRLENSDEKRRNPVSPHPGLFRQAAPAFPLRRSECSRMAVTRTRRKACLADLSPERQRTLPGRALLITRKQTVTFARAPQQDQADKAFTRVIQTRRSLREII